MQLREAIKECSTFGLMVNELHLSTSIGRQKLLSTFMMTDKDQLQLALDRVERIYLSFRLPEQKAAISNVTRQLGHIQNISGTLNNLRSGAVLDDLELFEVKQFSLTVDIISSILGEAKIATIEIPDLTEVIAVLDPERLRVPRFYIYDAYSVELTNVRKLLKAEREKLSKLSLSDSLLKAQEREVDQLYQKEQELEDAIRENLAEQLKPYADRLLEAIDCVAELDILIAKATQSEQLGLSKPQINEENIEYQGLFNPPVKEQLESRGKRYQPVDVVLYSAPCLITGANMSGKTLLLKTLQLSQLMFQFGFYLPAESASVVIVNNIKVSIEDGQAEMKGLSSFAAEMLTINDIINTVKSGEKALILIDELARTTNPAEGKAIVQATVEILSDYNVFSLITTHYGGIHTACRRLRVKGFVEEDIKGALSAKNINDYIDYSLIEQDGTDVPMDAIRVATLLGVIPELTERAKLYIREE